MRAPVRTLAVVAVLLTSLVPSGAAAGVPPTTAVDHAAVPAAAAPALPLEGKVVVLDPGHQLGNRYHPAQVNATVDAGGFRKACNTTGTSTDAGYPESAFTMSVAGFAKKQLEALGATVHLTRTSESTALWGPCIDERGRAGARYDADAVVSIHADGAASSRHGFFVIRPALRDGWTDDVYADSRVLSRAIHHGLEGVGLPVANYYGGDGYDTRGDLGTLNWSDRPVVMVELGNMRNPTDASHMATTSWRRDVYARGLVEGLVDFLARGPAVGASVTGETTITPEETTTLKATYTKDGDPVPTATLRLQKLIAGRYRDVGTVAITDGVGTATLAPNHTARYRVVNHNASAVAASVKVRVLTYYVHAELSGPSTITSAGSTTLDVAYVKPSGPVPAATLQLQKHLSTGWRTVKEVTVTDGRGSITLAPNRSTSYRVVNHDGSRASRIIRVVVDDASLPTPS